MADEPMLLITPNAAALELLASLLNEEDSDLDHHHPADHHQG